MSRSGYTGRCHRWYGASPLAGGARLGLLSGCCCVWGKVEVGLVCGYLRIRTLIPLRRSAMYPNPTPMYTPILPLPPIITLTLNLNLSQPQSAASALTRAQDTWDPLPVLAIHPIVAGYIRRTNGERGEYCALRPGMG